MKKCPNCSTRTEGDYCPNCGTATVEEVVYQPVTVEKVFNDRPITVNDLPSNLKPLGAWAYFGYSLLFALPIVGFIMLLVFSFSDTNINRRNFARSFFCGLLVAAVIWVILVIILVVSGPAIANRLQEFYHSLPTV